MYSNIEEIIDEFIGEMECCEGCAKHGNVCGLGECYNEHKMMLESMLIEAYARGRQTGKDEAARKAAEEKEV